KPVFAAVLTVTNLNDNGPGSLRDTIAAAASGDTIVFAVTGTIALTSGDLVIDRNLIISGPGPGYVTVQRSSTIGTQTLTIFVIPNLVPPLTVSISGLTISNGLSEDRAGGIYK